MNKVTGKLTVYFQEPFWIGVFERLCDGKISAAKITFGAKPKDYEILEFILNHYDNLAFSPAVSAVSKDSGKNPKRLQRDVKKQLQNTGIGTKSQQALKLQHEKIKQDRKKQSSAQKLAEAKRLFEQKQQKKKAKHKGH